MWGYTLMSRGAFFTLDDGPAPEFDCCAALGEVKAGRLDLGVLSLQGRERSVLLCLVSLETAHPADTPERPHTAIPNPPPAQDTGISRKAIKIIPASVS